MRKKIEQRFENEWWDDGRILKKAPGMLGIQKKSFCVPFLKSGPYMSPRGINC